ncbi:MAG: hypothetical protein HY736_12785 [Verrucomicrobia bacterium]|nr:hypothetical protein [Verrucomicrobiota bacterium]
MPPSAMEKRVLIGPDSAREWSAAESTVEASAGRAPGGKSALHWHITVDHLAGEPKYPIGWPRIQRGLKDTARDWSGWDFLLVRILTETSRAALPSEPVGLTLYTPDRNGALNRPLHELRKGEWTEIMIPLAQVPRHHDVRQLQFHIAEAKYRHQDQLDFYFDEVALLRYAEPTLLDFAAESAVMFADAPQIPVRFQLAGVQPEASVAVICELRREGRGAVRAEVTATRGTHRTLLDVKQAKLPSGEYELTARAANGSTVATANVRLVESPWKGRGAGP